MNGEKIDECLEPYRKEVGLLDTVPGADKDSAAIFVVEMGIDMSIFDNSAKRAASWAGVSPGNNKC